MFNLRLISISRKEFTQIWRDPRTLALIVIMPIMQLLLMGYAATTNVRNVPMAVFDQDRSRESRALLESFLAADYFKVNKYTTSLDELLDVIHSGKSRAGLIIPPEYGRALVGKETAKIALVLDGSDPIGYRQRLALATAIVLRPTLLFLDEPTSGVDPVARRQFWELIYELADEGVTILVTTHYMDEAEYCTHVAIMHQGKLIGLDTPTGLKSDLPAGTIWRVIVDQPARTIDFLEHRKEVRSVTLSAESIKLHTRQKSSTQQLQTLMGKGGYSPGSISPVNGTLEDVFLWLARSK